MAETYLIASPAKSFKSDKIYRVVKDRAWDDMPFSYLVQVCSLNYKLGKMIATWATKDKFDNQNDALKKFNKLVNGK